MFFVPEGGRGFYGLTAVNPLQEDFIQIDVLFLVITDKIAQIIAGAAVITFLNAGIDPFTKIFGQGNVECCHLFSPPEELWHILAFIANTICHLVCHLISLILTNPPLGFAVFDAVQTTAEGNRPAETLARHRSAGDGIVRDTVALAFAVVRALLAGVRRREIALVLFQKAEPPPASASRSAGRLIRRRLALDFNRNGVGKDPARPRRTAFEQEFISISGAGGWFQIQCFP